MITDVKSQILSYVVYCLSYFCCTRCSKNISVASPNGVINLNIINTEEGILSYSFTYKKKKIIETSNLGFSFSKPALQLTKFIISAFDTTLHDETWKPVWGEVSQIRNYYKELIVRLEDKAGSGILVKVVFRVFNDGVGFRYEFPGQASLSHFIVSDEHTQFKLSGDHKAFWIPGDYETNEYTYNITKLSEVDAISAAQKERDIALTAPIDANAVQTPLMMKTAEGLYVNIHEAALRNYPVMNLGLDKKTFTLTTHLVPDAVGNKAYLQAPTRTPWRTVMVSDKAADLLASNMILNLNEPSVIGDARVGKTTKVRRHVVGDAYRKS